MLRAAGPRGLRCARVAQVLEQLAYQVVELAILAICAREKQFMHRLAVSERCSHSRGAAAAVTEDSCERTHLEVARRKLAPSLNVGRPVGPGQQTTKHGRDARGLLCKGKVVCLFDEDFLTTCTGADTGTQSHKPQGNVLRTKTRGSPMCGPSNSITCAEHIAMMTLLLQPCKSQEGRQSRPRQEAKRKRAGTGTVNTCQLHLLYTQQRNQDLRSESWSRAEDPP